MAHPADVDAGAPAMSVATRMRMSPLRKQAEPHVRAWGWLLLPWIASGGDADGVKALHHPIGHRAWCG